MIRASQLPTRSAVPWRRVVRLDLTIDAEALMPKRSRRGDGGQNKALILRR